VLDPTKRAELDQMMALMQDTLPSIIAGLFRKFKEEEEFSEIQAWELAKIAMICMCNGRITV